MKLAGSNCLVTGGASGIGKALVLHFLQQGANVTAVDIAADNLKRLASEAAQHASQLLTHVCDVGNDAAQHAAFEAHMSRFGSLHVAVLNAGVLERGDVFLSDDDRWQSTLDIDLRAVLVGARCAARCMLRKSTRGVVLSLASAAGIYAVPQAPVYATAKAGVVQFTRSVAQRMASRYGIRFCAVCPQYVDTPFVSAMMAEQPKVGEVMLRAVRGKLLTTDDVVAVAARLIDDDTEVGSCVILFSTGQTAKYPMRDTDVKVLPWPRAVQSGTPQHALTAAQQAAWLAWVSGPRPKTLHKIQVIKLSTKFSEATAIVQAAVPDKLPAGHVLIKRAYAGINASDINFSAGRYHGSERAAAEQLPFDAGFETVGVVMEAAADTGLQRGDAVGTMTYGGFSDYAVLPSRHALRLPHAAPQMLALLTSGLTASIALEQVGRMTSGEVVLVTAAAGGTGQFAVQLAKLAGNTVVATCGSDDKAAMLRRIGADRVINYRTESVFEVLRKEFPKGVDIVYESVGGEMFDAAVRNVARGGRVIVIGMMSQYEHADMRSSHPGLTERLLWKSATVAGFFLPHATQHMRRHLQQLTQLYTSGALHVVMDDASFVGLHSVAAAVQHLLSSDSRGKVFVQLWRDTPHASVQRSRL